MAAAVLCFFFHMGVAAQQAVTWVGATGLPERLCVGSSHCWLILRFNLAVLRCLSRLFPSLSIASSIVAATPVATYSCGCTF
ncbi:hypothetical protein GQ54DRAFT_296362 [Martensiomyces pterosporus]|nr:hypothetical protein GQ54DRAFT_296362 [Martensiomyces pterosporus]